MKHLFKCRFLISNVCNTLMNSHSNISTTFKLVCFSILSNNPLSNTLQDCRKEVQGFGPLFNEILGILGTENNSVDKDDPSGFLVYKETNSEENVISSEPSETVCENANEKLKMENSLIIDGSDLEDVSPIVHKITGIVRGEDNMEEKLEGADFEYNEEIVVNVLKRCFTVPHLALRFFNWVKLRERFRHTTETFNTMINVAAEAREVDLVDELVEQMEKSFCERNIKTWTLIVSYYSKPKLIGKALMVFEEMKKAGVEPDAISYRIMLRSLCNARKPEIALEFYKEVMHKDGVMNVGLYKKLLNCFALCGDVASVRLVGDNMIRVSEIPEPSVYSSMLKSFCIAGRIRDALELIRDMKHKNLDLDTEDFKTLVKGLCSTNRISDAMEIVEIMKKRNVFERSVYEVVISAFLRKNEVCKAFNLFQEIKNTGAIPISICTNLVQRLFRENEFQKGMEIYNEMVEKGIQLDNVAITAVAAGYIKQNGISETQEIYKSMDEKEIKTTSIACLPESTPKSYSNNEMLEICQILSSSDDWCSIQQKLENCFFQITPDFVEEILRTCRQNGGNVLNFFTWVGKQSGYSHNAILYNMAMKIAGQGKDFKQMRSLFHEMRRRGCLITPDTWTIMIMQYGRTGLTDLALSKFREMKISSCKPTKSTYKSLIISLCGKKGRKVDEAIQIYEEMARVGCIPDKELIEIYIGCLCEVNKLSDARSCIKSLNKFGFSNPLAYSLYFRALCRAGKLEEALALMDEIGAEKNILDQYTYGSLIHGFLRKGRLEEALTKIKSMKQVGIYPTVHVYTALIIHYFKEKEISKALETLEEMKEQGCEPTIVTYSAVISGYVRMGRVTDAWKIFDKLKRDGPLPDFKTYTMFIDCLCKNGKSEEAIELLSDMVDCGIVPSTVNFRNIIYGLNREGKPNLAKIVLKKKLDIKQRRKMFLED